MTANEHHVERKSSIPDGEPTESIHAPRAQLYTKRKYRDSRGRLLPGHPGLKPMGAIGWRKRIAYLAREEEPPARLVCRGLEEVWYSVKERALLGDMKAVHTLLRMAGLCERRRRFP